jgi:hypothetical protein
MAFFFIWPRLAPIFALAILLSAPLAPFEVWANIIRGDYPPRRLT